jgi:hypothetical protein
MADVRAARLAIGYAGIGCCGSRQTLRKRLPGQFNNAARRSRAARGSDGTPSRPSPSVRTAMTPRATVTPMATVAPTTIAVVAVAPTAVLNELRKRIAGLCSRHSRESRGGSNGAD